MKKQPSLKAAAEVSDDKTISKSVPTFAVDPRTLVVEEGFNARPILPEHVAYLKALMLAGVDVGWLTVAMIDGKRVLRDGHHRHAAAMELIAEGHDIKTVKCLEFKSQDERDAILFMLGTQSGLQYTPLQKGAKYAELVNLYGMSFGEIAKARGCTVQNIKDAIQLTQQPAEIQRMITAGEITSSTAMKVIKNAGSSKDALKTIKAAAQVAKDTGKTHVTMKSVNAVPKKQLSTVRDALAAGIGAAPVTEAQQRTQVAREHIEAMLGSPTFDAASKRVLAQTRDLLNGIAIGNPGRSAAEDAKYRDLWLSQQREHDHSDVKRAAALLQLVNSGKKLPDDTSGEATYFGHMVWLQDMAAKTSSPQSVRQACRWFIAVLEARRSGVEVAPAPQVLSLAEAMQAEIDSDGGVLAETLCPEHEELIKKWRGE